MKNFFLIALINIIFFISKVFCQSGVIIMSPEPGSTVQGDDVLVAVSLIGISNPSVGTIQVLLDGVDITDDS